MKALKWVILLVLVSSLRGDPMTEQETQPFETAWKQAVVHRILDADSLDLMIDLGFEVHLKTRVRLLGIDAWEVSGTEKPKGLIAKQRVEELIPVGTVVRIKSKKGGSKESFGRWLVELVYPVTEKQWTLLNQVLLDEGHAQPYKK